MFTKHQRFSIGGVSKSISIRLSPTVRCHSVEVAPPNKNLRAANHLDIEFFRSTGAKVLTNNLEEFTIDWTKKWNSPSTSVVVQPYQTNQVAQVLQHCNRHRLGVVCQSGNTGLVGGGIPKSNEIILSMKNMTNIYKFNEISGILQCDAGCVLQTLQEHVSQFHHRMPLDLGAKGSCLIGGNVATNAGGQYYYRYGSIAANLLGLEVVLSDGRIMNWNFGSDIFKDNTGYKLSQLFVGSEGTLGIITGVSILCQPALTNQLTALLACESFDNVLKTMALAKSKLGEILAAIEWMDGKVVEIISQHINEEIPLQDDGEFFPNYLLVETHGSCPEHDQSKMEDFLEVITEKFILADGLLAQDMKQSNTLWRIRESANPAVAASGFTYKYDVSLPGSRFDGFINAMDVQLKSLDVTTCGWGHILDGNLHFNVIQKGCFHEENDVRKKLEPFLFDTVMNSGGSISAEHGVGQAKRSLMTSIKDEDTIKLMRSLKQMFDPNGILNPGKVIPSLKVHD
jgi:FAD/FMN-containing dehydrogenase